MKSTGEKIIKIIKLGRFQFIFGGFLYFCLGAFFAVLLNADFALNKFLLGYAIFFMAHLSMHYSNDYFDMEADKHGIPSQFAGGSGILIENPELKNFSKWFSITLLSLSLILAAVFVAIFSYSIWFFIFVLFGNFLAFFYAAPPIKLSYKGIWRTCNNFHRLFDACNGLFNPDGNNKYAFRYFLHTSAPLPATCLLILSKFRIWKEIN